MMTFATIRSAVNFRMSRIFGDGSPYQIVDAIVMRIAIQVRCDMCCRWWASLESFKYQPVDLMVTRISVDI